jgi:hypothetical protein
MIYDSGTYDSGIYLKDHGELLWNIFGGLLCVIMVLWYYGY